MRGGDRQHTHWNAMDLHGSSEDARTLPNSNKVNSAITAELGFRTVTIEFAGCRGRIPRERIDGKTMNSKLPLSSCSCDVDGLGRPNEWRCLGISMRGIRRPANHYALFVIAFSTTSISLGSFAGHSAAVTRSRKKSCPSALH